MTALVMFSACGDDDDQNGGDDFALDPQTSTVVYEFNDSSVPPEFHRSYTLTADAAAARLVVDSYGDIVHDVTEPMSADVWQHTVEAAESLSTVTDVTSQGCAGGTSEQLRVLDGEDRPVVDVHIDRCGSAAGPDLAAVVGDALALFDLNALLATD